MGITSKGLWKVTLAILLLLFIALQGCAGSPKIRSLVIENRTRQETTIVWLAPKTLGKKDRVLGKFTQSPKSSNAFEYRQNGYYHENARRLQIVVDGKAVVELEIPERVERTEPIVYTFHGCAK